MGRTDDQAAIPPAEVRHRVANVFQLMATLGRLRVQRAEDPETRRQLAWLLDATAALGVLQQRLLRPGGDDFARFLEDMAPLWARRVEDRPVSIKLEAEPVAVSEQVAAALAVIAHELVTNALAHAFPDGRFGVVRVELKRLETGRAALTVADNGVGYAPPAVDDRRRLGRWLIGGLADQVRGTLTTTVEDGVVVRLEFPQA
jgi:two-component sensor histidine kinase